MNTLRQWRERLVDQVLVTRHRLHAVLRGHRAVQVIFTGSDLPGLHYLVDEIRRLAPTLRLSHDPVSATQSAHELAGLLWSWHPDDSIHHDDIINGIGRYRDIIVVAATADPRESVCTRDPRIPQQFVDASDYRIRFGPSGKRSFTGPGVLPRLDGLHSWAADSRVSVLTIAREQLHTAPGEIFRQLHDVLGKRAGSSSEVLDRLAENAIAMPSPTGWAGTTDTRHRVAQQIELAPELERHAIDMGYPAADDLLGPTHSNAPTPRGTVIAFHTPDEVYRAEAARLKASLDALGLEHHFFEVQPEGNWVRTTLLKPSWIIRAREELSGPLLYIDVDAVVHADPWPYLQQYDGDMAAVVYDNGQLNSATLWINDTPGAREVLSAWKAAADARRADDHGELEATGDNGDQGVLKIAVVNEEASNQPRFYFQRLPVNLASIFDRTDATYIVGDVFIEQLQVSRESQGHEKRLARRRQRLRELEARGNSTQPASPSAPGVASRKPAN